MAGSIFGNIFRVSTFGESYARTIRILHPTTDRDMQTTPLMKNTVLETTEVVEDLQVERPLPEWRQEQLQPRF